MYDNNSILIVRIESPEAIKDIGCNSLWCFTYGNEYENSLRNWYNYSTNGIVYVIFNFRMKYDDPYFMCVLVRPLVYPKQTNKNQLRIPFDDEDVNDEDVNEYKFFTQDNDEVYNPIHYLDSIIGLENAKKIFTFSFDEE